MDFKRMTMFFVIALLILLGWEQMFPAPKPAQQAITQQANQAKTSAPDLSLTPGGLAVDPRGFSQL